MIFEIVLDEAGLDPLLAKHKRSLPIQDIIYRVLPISLSGRFSDH